MNELIKSFFIVFLWSLFTAQTQRDFLSNLQRSQSPSSDSFFIVLGGIALIVVIVAVRFVLKKISMKNQINLILEQKTNRRLDLKFSQLNLSSESQEVLEQIAGKDRNPETMLDMLDSIENFEEQVEEFLKREPKAKILNQLHEVRRQLGFDFMNRTVPFLSTKMLSAGLKLECRIPHPQRKILFIARVIEVTDRNILIKSPTKKPNPYFDKKKTLVCRITRVDESKEYEFQVPILKQVSGKMNALLLGHSKDIQELASREYERIPMSLMAIFHVISKETLEMDGEDSNDHFDIQFKGKILDMSEGGLQVETDSLPPGLRKNDFLIFGLPQTNLGGDLTSRVLQVVPHGNGHKINLQFVRLEETIRLRMKKFLYTVKKAQENALRTQLAKQKQQAEKIQNYFEKL